MVDLDQQPSLTLPWRGTRLLPRPRVAIHSHGRDHSAPAKPHLKIEPLWNITISRLITTIDPPHNRHNICTIKDPLVLKFGSGTDGRCYAWSHLCSAILCWNDARLQMQAKVCNGYMTLQKTSSPRPYSQSRLILAKYSQEGKPLYNVNVMFCSAVTGIQPNWRADLAQGVIDVRCLQQNQRPGVGFAKRTVTPTEEMRPVFLRGFDYLFGRRFTFEGDIFPKPCIFIIQENLHNWPYLRGTVPAYLSASKCNREAMPSSLTLQAQGQMWTYDVPRACWCKIYTQVIQDLTRTKSARTEQTQISKALYVKLGSLIGWSVKPKAAASSEQWNYRLCILCSPVVCYKVAASVRLWP